MSTHSTPETAMPRQKRKTLEERIADRQAQKPPLEDGGGQFEHGPAKFVFIFIIVLVVVLHLAGLIVLMMLDR